MAWNFQDNLPIYSQLVDQLKRAVVSGEYAPGGKLPSVRELAADAGINPNTVQRAFGELERDGLVFTQRTSGKFVTEDTEKIETIKQELARSEIRHFLISMFSLGYGRAQTMQMLEMTREGEETNAHS
jgi:GntR family transcriptional regulator